MYRRFIRKANADIEKNKMKKKITSLRKEPLESIENTTWDLINTKNPDGTRSVKVL